MPKRSQFLLGGFLKLLLILAAFVLVFVPRSTSARSLLLPATIHEDEDAFSGTWTLEGRRYDAEWDNGALAIITVKSFTERSVELDRTDTPDSVSYGLTAVYTGEIAKTGDHIVGSVTWTWPGHSGFPAKGTWTASW